MSSTDGHIDGSGGVDSVALRVLLDGPRREVREHTRAILSRPEFAKPAEPMPTEEYRARVSEWTRMLASTGGPALLFPEEFGGLGRVGDAIAGFETLALSDLSLLVKCGVQFGLFGGAVHHLGSRKHHERYLADIATFELPGSFAMSETGHGSNVQQVQTRATYDPATEEFVIETPTDADRKDFIGNAARDARMAAVFCQLVVGGTERGVHCVLVPLRDGDGQVPAGVRIEDCGHKLGLNGVDNGRIWFDGIRVPRENLLDRYAQVSAEGVYTSPISNENRRFFTMLGTLIQGRISVGGAAISATKAALATAIRHGLRRRQFGPPTPPRRCRCLITASTSGACSRRSRARTRSTSRSRAWWRSSTGSSAPTTARPSKARRSRRRGASSKREQPGSKRSPPGTRRRRSRPAASPAAAPAT